MNPNDVPVHHRVVIKYYTGGKSITDSASKSDSTNDTLTVRGHIPDEDISIALGAKWGDALGSLLPGARQLGNTLRGVRKLKKLYSAAGVVGSAAANAPKLASATSNITFGDPALSALMYEGSDNPKFSLTLEFHSDGDAYNDVLVPVMTLSKMTLPSRRSVGILEIPGPSPFDEYKRLFKDFSEAGVSFVGRLTGSDDGSTAAALGPDNAGNGDADGNAQGNDPRISVQVGSLMYFRSVVITGLDITMGSQVDQNRRPIYARVRVDFTRFTTPLREEVEEMFFTGKMDGQQNAEVKGDYE